MQRSKAKTRLELDSGSALIMAGKTQQLYKHGIPIQKVGRKAVNSCRQEGEKRGSSTVNEDVYLYNVYK